VYTAGAVLGALAAVVVLWTLSMLVAPVPSSIRRAIVLVLAVVSLLRDIGPLRFRLPERRSLIPQAVVTKGFPRSHLQFGFEMGTGVRTFLPTSGAHLLAASAVLLRPDVSGLLAVAVGFGVVRAMPLWLGELRGWDERQRWLARAIGSTVQVRGMALAAVTAAALSLLWP
jgi:hypothetical protein